MVHFFWKTHASGSFGPSPHPLQSQQENPEDFFCSCHILYNSLRLFFSSSHHMTTRGLPDPKEYTRSRLITRSHLELSEI